MVPDPIVVLLRVDVHMTTLSLSLSDHTQHLVGFRMLAHKVSGNINTQLL